MALDFSQAAGQKTFARALNESAEKHNSQKVISLPLEMIDEHPDNDSIVNMDGIEGLAQAMEEEGFVGAIEVVKKEDGRYEILSGHRRYRAKKSNGDKTIDCFILPPMDEISKTKRMLNANFKGRKYGPLEYANAIEYYTTHALIPAGITEASKIAEECQKYFEISKTHYYRYLAIRELIPEVKELIKEEDFPFTSLVDVAKKMTTEEQKSAVEQIRDFMREHNNEIRRADIEMLFGTKKEQKSERVVVNETLEPMEPVQPSIRRKSMFQNHEEKQQETETQKNAERANDLTPMFMEKPISMVEKIKEIFNGIINECENLNEAEREDVYQYIANKISDMQK